MAAPLKPWERNMPVNHRQPSFNPDQANSFITAPNITQIGGGGGLSTNNYPPPLPPRPSNYGVSSMSHQPYRSYNTFGGYQGFGGSYLGGYSGYGGYGGYGGYNRLSAEPDENGFIQAAEESSRQAFQSIESIVHAFGSVSMMLESTYHAVHSSFRAVLGVAEHFSRMKSHFAQIFSALAVVRTLRWLYRKLLFLVGLRIQDPSLEAAWQATGSTAKTPSGPLTEADLKASKSSWPIVMFLAVVFGGPYLIWRLLSSLAPNIKAKSSSWMKGEGEHYAAIGAYNFQGGSNQELSFRSGESLVLAPKNQQPNVRGWLLASNKKKSGLVPANYIRILGLRQSSSATNSNMLKSQGGVMSIAANTKGTPPVPVAVESRADSSNASNSDEDIQKFNAEPSTIRYESEQLAHDYLSPNGSEHVNIENKDTPLSSSLQNGLDLETENNNCQTSSEASAKITESESKQEEIKEESNDAKDSNNTQ